MREAHQLHALREMAARDVYTGNAEVDHLLFRWDSVIANAQERSRGFALSIQRSRKTPGWEPSPKQLALMKRLVADLPPVRGRMKST